MIFTAASPYVGIDRDWQAGFTVSEEELAAQQPHATILTHVEADELPFEDGTVREVFMGDVMIAYERTS